MSYQTRFIARVTAAILFAVGALAGVQAQAPKEPQTAVLSGSALGKVTLSHQAHTKEYGAKCGACHHAAKPEKAPRAEHERCADCHTRVATPPMKTKAQAAFHDPMAKKGVCIGCHTEAAAKGGKKAPAKCGDCHKK